MTAAALDSTLCYSGSHDCAAWEGRHVPDVSRFRAFVREVVRGRVADTEASFEADILGLATTGMATEFVERLLRAVPEPLDWEIGEALAECALATDSGREVHWPWNTVRDRRTPRASLPGADLVGFVRRGEAVLLLFGEVKTSSDQGAPPNVMYGGSGMTWQLEESATRLDIQRSLLEWLHARCQSGPHRDMYEQAVGLYIESGGKELVLVGVLVRDTEPNEADLRSRGKALAQRVGAPTRAELIAWYLPAPISDLPKFLLEDEP